jgi:DNA-binding XRE family transcriptional regulator
MPSESHRPRSKVPSSSTVLSASLSLFQHLAHEVAAQADDAVPAEEIPKVQGVHKSQGRVGQNNGPVDLAVSPTRKDSRYLLEGETRLDATTAQLISQLSRLRWPRQWSSIRRFDALAQAEVERLQRIHGTGDSPLLTRKMRGQTEVVGLSSKAEEALITREGERGFRRVIKGESGLEREYFVKRLATADGYIETRLSWLGAAWPLFEEATAKIESGFQAFQARQQGLQRSLFEELDEEQRQRADGQLRLMESVRHGRLVLDYLVRLFGRDGVNPVRVAAWDLKALLSCENDPHGMRKVRGCLEALTEIRFEMHLKGAGQRARTFGLLLSEIQYVGGGIGDHSDGHFFIYLAPSAIGCLAVFGLEKEKPALVPRTIAPAALESHNHEFDWKKSLSPAELERLKSGFTRSNMALAPHYDRAHGLTPTQAALLRWIEKQLTQERDPSRFKTTPVTPGDRTPRLYSHLFCPVLPQGRTFLGALGHFRDKPERGRKLASLAKEIGMPWPLPRAKVAHHAAVNSLLKDLYMVVEDVLGGLVTAFVPTAAPVRPKRGQDQGEWLVRSQIAARSPEDVAPQAHFLLFISPDYMSRLIEKLEYYYQQRFENGDSPYLIKVKRPGESASEYVDEDMPLHERLKMARKERGLTQAALGLELGVSQSMVNHWERGLSLSADGKLRGKAISPEAADKIEAWLRQSI